LVAEFETTLAAANQLAQNFYHPLNHKQSYFKYYQKKIWTNNFW
jgi:hypothetical protein